MRRSLIAAGLGLALAPALVQAGGVPTAMGDAGNFSAAGAVDMRYRNSVDTPIAQLEAGEDNYRRALLAMSPRVGDGILLFGVEHSQTDGPRLLDENFRKTNALLRYSRKTDVDLFAIAA